MASLSARTGRGTAAANQAAFGKMTMVVGDAASKGEIATRTVIETMGSIDGPRSAIAVTGWFAATTGTTVCDFRVGSGFIIDLPSNE
jgi:hypothetical protein